MNQVGTTIDLRSASNLRISRQPAIILFVISEQYQKCDNHINKLAPNCCLRKEHGTLCAHSELQGVGKNGSNGFDRLADSPAHRNTRTGSAMVGIKSAGTVSGPDTDATVNRNVLAGR